jgi:diguanylate cyclase (GGDEF)-like protein
MSELPVQAGGRRPRSTRAWVVGLVAACTLPTFLACAAVVLTDYQRTREQMLRDALGMARALTAVVDRDLAGSRSGLVALASSPSLASGDFARFYEQARAVQQAYNVNNIVVIDATHRQVLNTLVPYGQPLPEERNPALLQVLQRGRPVVTDLFMGAVLRRPLLAIAVPVVREGRVDLVLAAGVWPERLAKVLTQQRLPEGWIAGIFDSTGTVVARTHEIQRFIGQKGSPELVRRMTQEPEGSLESVTLEGVPVLSVYSRSAVSNWSVAIGIPREAFRRPLRESLLKLTAAALLMTGLALGAAWYVGQRMAGSLRALVAPAQALGRGDPVQVPPLDLAEAVEVGDAMARTSSLLRQAVDRSLHDPLTGLANRTLFDQFLQTQLSVARRTRGNLAVLYLDLDGFKAINDRWGHARGDELLRWVSKQLAAVVRDADLVARLGGDEFALVLVGVDARGARQVAAKLLQSLGQAPSDLAPRGSVGASVGAALYPGSAASPEALLHCADQAMYEAKASAGRVVVRAA